MSGAYPSAPPAYADAQSIAPLVPPSPGPSLGRARKVSFYHASLSACAAFAVLFVLGTAVAVTVLLVKVATIQDRLDSPITPLAKECLRNKCSDDPCPEGYACRCRVDGQQVCVVGDLGHLAKDVAALERIADKLDTVGKELKVKTALLDHEMGKVQTWINATETMQLKILNSTVNYMANVASALGQLGDRLSALERKVSGTGGPRASAAVALFSALLVLLR